MLHRRPSAEALFVIFAITMLGRYNLSWSATIDNWNIAGGGNWNSGASWSTGSVPTMAEDAVIGPKATSVTSPVSIFLNTSATAYGITLDPVTGKAITIGPGPIDIAILKLLSTDTAPDGINKFFTINAASGFGNQINTRIALGDAAKGTFTAMINSFDPAFAIRGGIAEAAASWGVRISGNNQGIVSYGGTASTYSGDTTIAPGGILRMDFNNAIPSGTGRGNLALEGNGELQFLNATALTINGLNSLSATSLVTNIPANNGVTLTLGSANANGNYAGSIANPTGTGLFNVVKTGSGKQKLTGANSYRGTTQILGGTLLVDGTHTNAGNYTTAAQATLGGTGTINLFEKNSVTINTGFLAPGDTGPGVLNINGVLNMSSIGTLKVDLGGAFPGNGASFYDQVNMTNPATALNANAAHLSVSLVNGFVPRPNDVFYILTKASPGAFESTQPFDTYREGATIRLGEGVPGIVTYKANWTGSQATSTITGGNDMAIYIVPEPASASLIAMGLLAAVAFRRR